MHSRHGRTVIATRSIFASLAILCLVPGPNTSRSPSSDPGVSNKVKPRGNPSDSKSSKVVSIANYAPPSAIHFFLSTNMGKSPLLPPSSCAHGRPNYATFLVLSAIKSLAFTYTLRRKVPPPAVPYRSYPNRESRQGAPEAPHSKIGAYCLLWGSKIGWVWKMRQFLVGAPRPPRGACTPSDSPLRLPVFPGAERRDTPPPMTTTWVTED